MEKGEGAPGDLEKSGGRGERAHGQRRATPRGPALWLHLVGGDMRVTVRTPMPRAPPRPAHPDSGPHPARRLWTYVIVAPLPEVEGPDGPEEQQHRPRNEDHSSDLEQPRGAGGLHGHRGVCLRAGAGEVGEGGPVTSAPPAPPHPAPPVEVGNGASPFAALRPEGPLYSGVDVRSANFCPRRARAPRLCTLRPPQDARSCVRSHPPFHGRLGTREACTRGGLGTSLPDSGARIPDSGQ